MHRLVLISSLFVIIFDEPVLGEKWVNPYFVLNSSYCTLLDLICPYWHYWLLLSSICLYWSLFVHIGPYLPNSHPLVTRLF